MTDTEFIAFDDIRLRIGNELAILNDAWSQYTFLFASPSHVEILNACARWHFATTQRLLLREVILGISRLTDPPSQGKNQNLVLATIVQDPALETRPALREKLNGLVSEARSAATA